MLKMVDGTGIIGVDMICPLGVSTPQPPNYDRVELEGAGMLVLPNSLDAPLERLELGGKTEQVQTTGKNLFDKNSVVNSVIIADGTVTDNAPLYVTSDYIPVKPSVTYACTETGSKRLKFFDADKQPVQNINFEDANVERGGTFTTGETTSFIRLSLLREKLDSITLNEGSKSTPYEPYTGGKPAPSPEYPQDIVNAGKLNEDTGKYEVEISISGRNLFDFSACEEGKAFEASGNIISAANGLLTDFIPCFPNSQYSRTPTGFTVVAFYDCDKNKIGFEIVGNATFVTPEKCRYFRYSINKVQVDYKKLVACPGDTAMDYEPYYHKPIFLNLTSDRPITKWDKLVEQGGQIGWLYQSKIAYLTGEEEWKSSLNAFYTTTYNFIKNNAAKCSHYVLGGITNQEKNNIFSIGDGAYTNSLWIRDARFSTARDFKAHLSDLAEKGTPIMVVSPVASTEFVPLPQSEQAAIRALKTYYPTTVITADGGELDPDIKVTYRKEI